MAKRFRELVVLRDQESEAVVLAAVDGARLRARQSAGHAQDVGDGGQRANVHIEPPWVRGVRRTRFLAVHRRAESQRWQQMEGQDGARRKGLIYCTRRSCTRTVLDENSPPRVAGVGGK